MRTPLALILLPLLPLLTAACSGEAPSVPVEPTVQIDAPSDGASVAGSVDVLLTITDFELTDPEAAAATRSAPPWAALLPTALAHTPGAEPAGYVEVRLDGIAVSQEVADAFTVDVTVLEPGEHLLEVELLWPDGDAFFPRALDAVGILLD